MIKRTSAEEAVQALPEDEMHEMCEYCNETGHGMNAKGLHVTPLTPLKGDLCEAPNTNNYVRCVVKLKCKCLKPRNLYYT